MDQSMDICEYPGPTPSASAPILHVSDSRTSNLSTYQHRSDRPRPKSPTGSQSSTYYKPRAERGRFYGSVEDVEDAGGWRCWKWCGLNTKAKRGTLIVGLMHFALMIGFIVFGVGMWISFSNALYGLWVLGGLLGGPCTVALFCGLHRKQRHLFLPFMIFQGFGLIVLTVFLLMCISLLVELAGSNESSGIQKTFGIDPKDKVPHQIAFASFYMGMMLFIFGGEIWSLIVVRRCYRQFKSAAVEEANLVGEDKLVRYN